MPATATADGEVSLVARIGSLEVSILGPVSEATELLHHLQAFRPQRAEVEPETPSPVSQRPLPPSRTLSSPGTASSSAYSASVPASQVPLPASGPELPRTRTDLARQFPPCPASVLRRATALQGGANISAQDRILRAWTAGLWAREVLDGHVGTPVPSERISLPSRVYCVLGGGSARPAVYRTFRDYSAALGPLHLSASVSHGFPSEAEAQTYTEAAGLSWPPGSQQ